MFQWADDILRARPWMVQERAGHKRLGQLLAVLFCFGFVYGAVMGSYSGLFGHRWLQVLYSAIKVPLLLVATFGLGLPFYFVLNSLLGLRDDFSQSVRTLVATQAGLTVIMASLSPVTLVWYASFENYRAAILFNAAIFGVASVLAQIILRNLSQPLIRKNPRHLWLVRSWLVIYAFVGIQMGWILRPFIGSPNVPTQFFREGAWGNAYVKLAEIIVGLISGR